MLESSLSHDNNILDEDMDDDVASAHRVSSPAAGTSSSRTSGHDDPASTSGHQFGNDNNSSSKKRRKQSNPLRYGNKKVKNSGSSLAKKVSSNNTNNGVVEEDEESDEGSAASSVNNDSIEEDISQRASRVRRRLNLSSQNLASKDSDEEDEDGQVDDEDDGHGIYLCPFCSSSFTSDEASKAHIQEEHVIKLLERQLLQYQFGRSQSGNSQSQQQLNLLQQQQLLQSSLNNNGRSSTPGHHDNQQLPLTPESLLDPMQLQSLILSQQHREREQRSQQLHQQNRSNSRTSSRSSSTSNPPESPTTARKSNPSNTTFPSTESCSQSLRNLASAADGPTSFGNSMFPFPIGPQGLSPAEASKAMAGMFGPNPMAPFLFPGVFPGGQGNSGPPGRPTPGLGGSIPTSSGSFCIFNPEAYCEHCNKEFCNKYFLKVHKANKHGIYTGDNPPPNSSRSSTAGDQNSNSNGPSSERNTSGNNSGQANNPNNNNNGMSQENMSSDRNRNSTDHPFSQVTSVSAAAAAASAFFPAGLASGQVGQSDEPCNRERHQDRGTPSLTSQNILQDQVAAAAMAARMAAGQHQPQPPINLESYCEICQKEFCNKYFVKKHKQNVHGIKMSGGSASSTSNHNRPLQPSSRDQMDSMSSSSPPARETNRVMSNEDRALPSSPLSPTSSAISFIQQQQQLSNGGQEGVMSGLDAAFGGIGLKEYFNKFFSQASQGNNNVGSSSSNNRPGRDMKPGSSSSAKQHQEGNRLPMTSSNPITPFDLQSALAYSMSQQNRINGNNGQSPSSPGESSSRPLMPPNVIPNNNINNNGPSPSGTTTSTLPANPVNVPKNYCNICNKELCNKYFMKVHMLKMHQINIDEQPAEAAGASTIGGVTCDICQKELCSKYFLKVHKQNTHGIYEENSGRGGESGSGRSRTSTSMSSNMPPSIPVSSSSTQALPPAVTLQQHLSSLIPMSSSSNHHQNQSHQPNQEGMMTSSPPRDKESPQASRGIDPRDTNNRYFSHYTEVCPLCERRFKSIKWLKTHIQNDHSDMSNMMRHLPSLYDQPNDRGRSSSLANASHQTSGTIPMIPSPPRQTSMSSQGMQGSHPIMMAMNLADSEVEISRSTPNGVTESPNNRSNHENRSSNFSEVCPLCERRFRSLSWLKQHVMTEHSDLASLNRLPLFAGMNPVTRYKMMSFVLFALESMTNQPKQTEGSTTSSREVIETPEDQTPEDLLEEADQENQQNNST